MKLASQKFESELERTLSRIPKKQEIDETIIYQYTQMKHERLQHQIGSIGESFSYFRLWACLLAHLSAMKIKKIFMSPEK